MANEENLIKNEDLTPSQRRINASKAGKASAKARRKKRDMKQAMNMLMDLPISEANQQVLEQLGIPETEANNQMLMLAVTMQKALKGDMRAIEFIASLTTVSATDKEKFNIEKERIKLEKEKISPQESGDNEKVVIINDLSYSKIE